MYLLVKWILFHEGDGFGYFNDNETIPLFPVFLYKHIFLFQAFVGVAFSVGFVFGPIIGAVFSRYARDQQEVFYTVPALFALALAVIDIIFVLMFFKETLPENKRVNNLDLIEKIANVCISVAFSMS